MTELNDLRYTMFSIDGVRVSEEVHEIGFAAQDNQFRHFQERSIHKEFHMNMLTITFTPIIAVNGGLFIADTAKYQGRHKIELVSSNTRECLRGIGTLVKKNEQLQAADEWCGKHEWTFAMECVNTTVLTPEEMPKPVNFDDALKIAKEI